MMEFTLTPHYEVGLFVKYPASVDPDVPITKIVTITADDGPSAVIQAIKDGTIPVMLNLPNGDDEGDFVPTYWKESFGEPLIVLDESEGIITVQWDAADIEALVAVEYAGDPC